MKKRLLSVALILCMMLTLMPTTAFAATNYGIWLGVTQVTDENKDHITGFRIDGNVSYNPDTNTLTLKNATIGHAYRPGASYSIYAEQDLNIVLEGTNSVTGESYTGYKSIGIYTTGALEISGSGSLNVSSESGPSSYGIYTKGNLTILSGTITATSASSSETSSAIYSDGVVTISGGEVQASADLSAETSYGILGSQGVTIAESTVTGTGKIGLAAGSNTAPVAVSGGEVTATGSQVGIFGALSVTGGTVTAQSDIKALDGTLTTSGYTGGCAITADTDKNGSNAGAYDASKLATYQYIKVEPRAPQAQWGIAGSDDTAPTDWEQGTLAEAISYADNLESGTAYIQLLTHIDKNNNTTWPLTFDSGHDTVLDLNGHDIDRGLTAATFNGNVINIVGTALTLRDSSTAVVASQGKITGGYNQSPDGGCVYVNSKEDENDMFPETVFGSFKMESGNITGNRTTNLSVGGGGVYVKSQNCFVMTGGSVTGNKSANGGVRIDGPSFTVGGTAVIKDNMTTDTIPVERNVYVPNGKTITVSADAALTVGASVGVTTESVPTSVSPVNVTGNNSDDYSSYFFSDNSAYAIQNSGTDSAQVVQLAVPVPAPVPVPVIGTLAISDSFTAGHNLALSELNNYKPTITDNGVTITAQGWQNSVDSGDWNTWSAGELPLDTASTYKLRYYVTYNGDSGSTTITSFEVTLNVVGKTTTLVLTASPTSPQSAGTPVTLTATLTGFFAGPGVNGQTITFKSNGTTLGTANLDAGGVAAYTWTPGAVATYSLTAEYAATEYNAAAASSAVSYTVIVDPNIAIVAAAKTAAQGASYANMTQAAATDEDAIETALKNTAVTAVSNSDITITIDKDSYTPPIAGTSENPSGTNGSYTFSVTVSKGSQSETTEQKTIIITATAYTGGTGGGGGSGGGTNTPAPSTKPTEPVTGSTENKATVDNKGNASVSLTDKNITDAIADAKAEAAKKGVNAGDITAVIHVTTDGKTANTVTVNLPKTTQEQIIGNKIASVQLVIDRPDLTIGINLAAVTEINRQAKADVQLSATRMDNTKLSGNAKAAIGNRPAFDLKATFGIGKSVTHFGKGNVSVEIPYTLQKGELAGNVYAVYVDTKGKVTYLTDSSYDAKRGTVIFSTSHFSTYGVAYKASFNFTDINGRWAKDDILFVANHGLMTGTSATTFSPNSSMTRGMFVTALGRLANADTSSYKQSSFADVKADAYCMGYIEWGVKNNILVGIGGGKFDPDGLVTREQMAAIMNSYATAIGFKLPEVHAQNTFADKAKIGTWAAPSVKRIQMAGIIQGKSNNLYDPKGTATRDEVSAVLRRFVELDR